MVWSAWRSGAGVREGRTTQRRRQGGRCISLVCGTAPDGDFRAAHEQGHGRQNLRVGARAKVERAASKALAVDRILEMGQHLLAQHVVGDALGRRNVAVATLVGVVSKLLLERQRAAYRVASTVLSAVNGPLVATDELARRIETDLIAREPHHLVQRTSRLCEPDAQPGLVRLRQHVKLKVNLPQMSHGQSPAGPHRAVQSLASLLRHMVLAVECHSLVPRRL
mmetsp:Transcript_6350/g.19193  ORF Transcript_6350/g.19193 Transcript_6350/m.19193 type:complete len:223 (-) Transcript_6350:330-998(-)